MWIKNNSDRGWKNYNCGGGNFVDIKPKSIFEVEDSVGQVLLNLLGAPAWLVETEAPKKTKGQAKKAKK